jgi:hypothetical protein
MNSSIQPYHLNPQQIKPLIQGAARLNTYNRPSIAVKALSTPQNSATKPAVDIASQKRSLHFNIDPESGMVVIQVFDGTGQLIRQIPHEEMMSLTQRLDEVRGMLFADTI